MAEQVPGSPAERDTLAPHTAVRGPSNTHCSVRLIGSYFIWSGQIPTDAGKYFILFFLFLNPNQPEIIVVAEEGARLLDAGASVSLP